MSVFDDQQIVLLYQQGTTISSLAEQHQCSVDKIRWCLTKHNVLVSRKPAKCVLPEQEVIELYKNDLTPEQIGEKYGVSTGPIVKILNKYKVRKPVWAKQLAYKTYQQVTDKEIFLAATKTLVSKARVAEYFGINYDMVVSLCKYHNVSLPNSAEVRSLLNQQQAEHSLDKQTFINLYFQENYSIQQIAKMMNISVEYLRRKIKQWEVQTLPMGEIRLSKVFKQVRNDRELLRRKVEEEQVPVKQLCIEYNVSWEVMRRTLEEYEINIPIKYRSWGEQQLESFVRNLLPNIQINICDKTTIYPYELDIFLPEKKLAIEYCGLYWHSELTGKDKNYHLSKLQDCEQKGLRLLTIFEDEYQQTPTLVENRIKHVLGIFNGKKIGARQTLVKEISSKEKNDFLNKFHLQGQDISAINLGLFYKEQLVSVMTFSKPSRARTSKRIIQQMNIWELNRFATDYNYIVRGAAGKLLNYFVKNFQWSEIYSYADRRWSTGNLYHSLGFMQQSVSKPNYWYISKGYSKREYRYKYAKYRLVEQGYDKDLTEFQIMNARGFTRIWDCGVIKFVKEND